ncbi:MAG: hypothetical protein GY913_14620 [Proteobacteria bacterium]|nr:hypothetical protein [Pseudomonadota bacterium]MCP4918144.1 hypothetical protein [Pseudomonadota bacterium]
MLLLLLSCEPDPVLGDVDPRESLADSERDSAPPLADVRINEVFSTGPDWVELYGAADLSGWTLVGEGDEHDLSGTVDGFLVVEELAFGISSEGERLELVDAWGRVIDVLDVPALREDHSYGPEQLVEEHALLDGSALVTFEEPTGWPASATAGWTSVTLPIGFEGVDPDEVPENVALGRPTDQSSDWPGYTGVEGVDGTLSNFTHTATSDFDPWWWVDLEAEYGVSEVRLFNRVGCCPERLYNITVELLDTDGEPTWTSEVLNATDVAADPGESLIVYPDAIGSQLRVSKEAVGGTYESEWLSLAEVEVMGVTASPYAGRIETVVEEMRGVSDTAWVVLGVTGAEVDRALLEVEVDDAADVWLDGIEVVPGELDPAAVVADGSLAVRATTLDDEDFFLAVDLTGQRLTEGDLAFFSVPTPGEPNGQGFAGFVADPVVDIERGFYEAAQAVELSCETSDATLVYTLDGSVPTLENGDQVTSPHALEVPTTSLLRAAAFHTELKPSNTITHSYLFLEDVVDQPAAPDGFPATWAGMSQTAVTADYEMDPEVVDAIRDELVAGLRDIRTMSIVMPPEDLFGDVDGLYIHTQQRGEDWERVASIEIIEADGSTGIQVEAGVRVHGYGWRPHTNTKKHSLRLEFKSEYGPTKLEYPLFTDAPVDRFDSIVLRSQGSRGWQDFRDPEQAQYLRDSFARDTARDMGKSDGHATYVHLYLNGLYWGLYNPVERPDADFGAEYFGGDADEYDAINRRTTTNEAIDGTLDAYNELLAMADEDLTGGYAAIESVLDVEDLVDYMLIHQYTTNKDGPEVFSSNNMRGVRRNVDGGLWRFFVWDMEYSLWAATDDYNIDVDVAGSISHVYARLRTNPEFVQRYSDRAHEHLTGDGALTPDACAARYDARAQEIERAILGESARWGDTDRSTPYTRDVEWADERERLMSEYFPYRTDELIEQLRGHGLWLD